MKVDFFFNKRDDGGNTLLTFAEGFKKTRRAGLNVKPRLVDP